MESGTIVKWLKAEGEPVEKGEPLYELDTDKVTQEVEAEASGVLLRISVEQGEVEVGKTIAFIGEEGEAVAESAGADSAGEAPVEAEVVREPEPQRATAAPSTNGRIKASPLARRIAREKGIELSSLVGTGPDGRIVAQDLERAPIAPPVAAQAATTERRPLSTVRRTIARRLTEAWTVPAFQLTVDVDMTRANALVATQRE